MRLGGRNFRGYLLYVDLVLFRFNLQGLNEASVGHGERRGTKEGEWVHRKKGENDIYDYV